MENLIKVSKSFSLGKKKQLIRVYNFESYNTENFIFRFSYLLIVLSSIISSNGNIFNIIFLYIKTKVEWKIKKINVFYLDSPKIWYAPDGTKTCELMCQRTCATLSQSCSIQSIASFDHDRYKIKKKRKK